MSNNDIMAIVTEIRKASKDGHSNAYISIPKSKLMAMCNYVEDSVNPQPFEKEDKTLLVNVFSDKPKKKTPKKK